MITLNSILKEFLENTCRLKEVPLGHEQNKLPDSIDEYIQFLLIQLRRRVILNNRIMYSVITMYFILFGLGLMIIFFFLSSPKTVPLIFGGSSFIGLIAVVKGLTSLLKDSCRAEDLSTFIPELAPKEVVKIIESLYYSDLSNEKL